jgi:glycosyltransferase involved in cell wall biosynthesis
LILLSHPTGNANVRGILNGLASEKMLQNFYTSVAAYPGNIWHSLGGVQTLSEFRKRSFDLSIQPFTKIFPWYELGRMLSKKMKFNNLLTHESGLFSIDHSYQAFDQFVAKALNKKIKHLPKAVYAYEDGALETFKVAKRLGITCVYDLPIAYWETGRRLMKEEADRLPKWAATLGGGIKDSENKLMRKQKELELADIVVGPGSFVMDSLPDWSKNKMKIVSPFGSPHNISIDSKTDDRNNNNAHHNKLRVLFVGSMGQRKGLGDLFQAMQILNNPNVELVVLGSLLAPMEFYKNVFPNFTYEPVRSHSEILKLMRTCDVLCLPSIVEGRALVMQEAMSQGLPIIITPNTGGADLIIEGETGFLVPIRNASSIAEKINWFFENRYQLEYMGESAQKHASKYTWENYAKTIVDDLKQILNN